MTPPVRKWTPERHAIGSHTCWLQVNNRVTNASSSGTLSQNRRTENRTVDVRDNHGGIGCKRCWLIEREEGEENRTVDVRDNHSRLDFAGGLLGSVVPTRRGWVVCQQGGVEWYANKEGWSGTPTRRGWVVYQQEGVECGVV
jgi:hypothetical protein